MTRKPPRGPDLDDEDRALWRAVTRDVTPLQKQIEMQAAPPKDAPSPKAVNTLKTPVPQVDLMPEFALKPSAVKSAPSVSKSSFQTDKRTHEKFREGRMELDGTIDLHGLTLPDAHNAFAKFIRSHIKQKSRMLLVITGKGKGGEGVIRASLPSWIDEVDIHHDVLKFAPASAKHGGGGAFYILLRRAR